MSSDLYTTKSPPLTSPDASVNLSRFRFYRALISQDHLEVLGAFLDLDEHDDSHLYRKEEPPRAISGRRLPGDQRLDFIAVHPEAGLAGIEVKNVREWLYPDRAEIIDLLAKCCHLNAVPVLMARRYPYGTFSVLGSCGVILYQHYNQLYPLADAALADRAKHKDLLGFHDVRTGNQPDKRLTKFIHHDLPGVLPKARELFDQYYDLVASYAYGATPYAEFAARVKRRERGEPEDGAGYPSD